jgi:hypothetical protein
MQDVTNPVKRLETMFSLGLLSDTFPINSISGL